MKEIDGLVIDFYWVITSAYVCACFGRNSKDALRKGVKLDTLVGAVDVILSACIHIVAVVVVAIVVALVLLLLLSLLFMLTHLMVMQSLSAVNAISAFFCAVARCTQLLS